MATTVLVSCGFTKETGEPHTQAPNSAAEKPKLEALQVRLSDWEARESTVNGVRIKNSSVRPEKLDSIRKRFVIPQAREIQVPGNQTFTLYSLTGIEELEQTAFLHPKIYVNSATDRGTILGFRQNKKPGMVTLSIPVALVNGLSESVPLVSGDLSGTAAAVTLPENFRIKDPGKLSELLGKDLQSLPTCPKSFRLIFGKRQYLAESPFAEGAVCPTNQFFRVQFEAPEKELTEILETAAMRDDAVQVVADFDFSFLLPTKRTEVDLPIEQLFANVKELLSTSESVGLSDARKAYATDVAEVAAVKAIEKLVNSAGAAFKASGELPAFSALVVHRLFERPAQCPTDEACLLPRERVTAGQVVTYSWIEQERLGSVFRSNARTALGAVANGTKFLAKHDSTTLTNDGYLPLGAGTTVYPGAWMKLDVDQVQELTRAKTRTASDGSTVVQSEVIDALAKTPIADRVVCTEGARTACKSYQTKKVPARNTDGTPRRASTPCAKADEGKNGCKCTKMTSGQEECSIPGDAIFDETFETECDPSDIFTYCPYYREEEQVIDYEIEYECKDIQYEDHGNFLCISGCKVLHRLECKEKSRKPVKALRRVLNCIEDEKERLETRAKLGEKNLPAPQATAYRVQECRRPRYVCREWETQCTRYNLNEAYLLVHEEPAAKWRPFALEKGEFPPRFEEEVFLRFQSPTGRVATNCPLSKFTRELRGQSIFVKIPTEANEDSPCDVPIWDEHNVKPGKHPRVFIKNSVQYPQERLCGKTEYSFLTRNVPVSKESSTLPLKLEVESVSHIGPVKDSCTEKNARRRGNDLWFVEEPPIQFNGRVSVLGRMLESIVAPGAGR
jgi:hypothetical protein